VKEAASGILYQNIDRNCGDGARDGFVALDQPRRMQIKCAVTVIPACPARESELTAIVEHCLVATGNARLMSTRRTACEKRFGR
jgi:hypothetical protein